MGFAGGFEVGFNATSSLMESTFAAMRQRRENDEANKAMAEAETQQQEIDAKFMRMRQQKQAEIEASIETGELTSGHARALLSADDLDEQTKIAELIRDRALSVRDVERLAQRNRGGSKRSVSVPVRTRSGAVPFMSLMAGMAMG